MAKWDMGRGIGNWQRTGACCIASAAMLALSACQKDAAGEAQGRSTTVFEAIDPATQLMLQPLLAEELEEYPLSGDMGCYFATSPAADPLLVTRGLIQSPATRAAMLVKFGGEVVTGSATEDGGYDAMVDGSTFDTAALLVDVARIEAPEAGNSGLQPARAALRVRQAGQAEVIVQGYWTCGV